MQPNLDFKRYHKGETKEPGFEYKSEENPKDINSVFQSMSINRIGFNLAYNIQNYMAEPVLLGGNLRVNPTRIPSLRQDGLRPLDSNSNHVIVTICSSTVQQSPDPKKRIIETHKVEVRIPGRMLNRGAVFISELDCYIMTESQIDATRELIARDVLSHGGDVRDVINIPSSMISQDPAVIYIEYKQFAQFCLSRQDKIRVRVGMNIDYGRIPQEIKNLRIAILDSYFVPYTSNKVVYDPLLGEDEFVVENLHLASRDEFKMTFSELTRDKAVYLDYEEVPTLFGKFYGMALFSDAETYLDYVYRRKTQERFDEETLVLAHRSGDPKLKEEIARLNRDNKTLRSTVEERDEEIKILRSDNTRLKGNVKDRETQIDQLRTHHDVRMSAEYVVKEMTNEVSKIENDGRRIINDRLEMELKEKSQPMLHKAAMLKHIGDIIKSGWGIVTGIIGGILSLILLAKKYGIRVTMAV